jgi:hypothetical protein
VVVNEIEFIFKSADVASWKKKAIAVTGRVLRVVARRTRFA